MQVPRAILYPERWGGTAEDANLKLDARQVGMWRIIRAHRRAKLMAIPTCAPQH